MTVVERFTTNGLGRSARLDFWNRLTDETYPGTRVDTRGGVFEADMLRWTLGDLTMIRPRSRGSIVQRQCVANAPERIVLHLQHSGRSLHRQRGREAELAAGDFVLSDANEPYRIDIDDHEFLVIEMPREGLAARIPDLDDVISRRIGGQTPGARLLHNFLLSLWQQAEAGLADCDWQADASNVLLDLASFAVRDCRNAPMAAAPLRARIARLVEANLAHPHFSSVEIAAKLGVSVRTVQNAFSQEGTTPAAYILQRRLERAADMLRANPALSVTAVAFDLGFSDSGYFARCFRQHFKTSPSQWRIDTAIRTSAGT